MPLQIAESHRRQLNGEDYQAVAIEIAKRIGVTYESDEYTQLQTAPFDGCECAACSCFPWDDTNYPINET